MATCRSHAFGLVGLVTTCLFCLGACGEVATRPEPAYTVVVDGLNMDGDYLARMEISDPRVGPEEVVGKIWRDFDLVRRRVPAGVPVLCPALSAYGPVSKPVDRFVYGLRTPQGERMLPCVYDLVDVRDGSMIGWHRFPQTDAVLFFPAQSCRVHDRRVLVSQVANQRVSNYALGVREVDGIPRASEHFDFQLERISLGRRSWPLWSPAVSSGYFMWGGMTLYKHAASILRHDRDLVFYAPEVAYGRSEVWRIDIETCNVERIRDASYAFAYAIGMDDSSTVDTDDPPLDKIRAYVTKPAPHDAGLVWIRRPDGVFAPPPGTVGCVPLVRHGPRCDDPLVKQLPTSWQLATEQFLLAYDTPEGRRWGTADHDFAQVTGPIYRQILLRESPALNARLNYPLERFGSAYWVLAQRDRDGAWGIAHGRVAEDSAFRVVTDIEELVDKAELQQQDMNAHHGKLAEKLGQHYAVMAKMDAKRQAEQRAERQRQFEQALAASRGLQAWSLAIQLGDEAMRRYALSTLATRDQRKQVLQSRTLPDDVRERIEALMAAEEKRRADAAAQARQQAPGAAAGSTGNTDWSGWRRETMNAQSANQLGLTGQAYQDYMQRHR